MTYGWNTTKMEAGTYAWSVYSFEFGAGANILRSGVCSTRAKAVSQAKRNVMVYRRPAYHVAA